MSAPFFPLRQTSIQKSPYKAGDVLVVFGELFGKGYANGIVEAARKSGMTVIGSTVGRRENGELRPLREDELNAAKAIGEFDQFINVPLEAGFDLERSASGLSPVDQLKGVKMDDWDKVRLDWEQVNDSKAKGRASFEARVREYVAQLKKMIPSSARVLFVHTMAGGVPRAKILMPTMNRVFKGKGDRHIPSKSFWESEIGKLCDLSFNEVTAQTLQILIDATEPIQKLNRSAFVAYGYHGTEILIGDKYVWQTYAPYVQGWAKMKLEEVALQNKKKGITVSVYNCPEILTNSSGLFNGVELPLYPFLAALEKEGGKSPRVRKVMEYCSRHLKKEMKISDLLKVADEYMNLKLIAPLKVYNDFPQHSWKDQMETMLNASETMQAMELDGQSEITLSLSREIFEATGAIMLRESGEPANPVLWLGHDILAKEIASNSSN